MEQKALKLIMAGLLILSMALTGREAAEYVGAMHAVNALRETGMGADDSGRLCVVVDAGHGGDDPGKIGINGAPEKDINLQIAQKLKKYLEAEDVEVVLTRETEDGLYDAHASNKKVQDMKRRIEIIEKNRSCFDGKYSPEQLSGGIRTWGAGVLLYRKYGKRDTGFRHSGSAGTGTGPGESSQSQGQRQLLSSEEDQRNHRDRGVWLFVKSSGGGKALR